MPDSDPAAILDNLATQTWTTPDGEVTGKQAIDLLVWLSDKPTSTATSAEIAAQLDLPSASDRRCRRVVERLKDRGLVEYVPERKAWAILPLGLEVVDEVERRVRAALDYVGPTPAAPPPPADPYVAHTLRRMHGLAGLPGGPPACPPLPPRSAYRVCPVCDCVYHSRTRWCRGQKGYAHAAAHTHAVR